MLLRRFLGVLESTSPNIQTSFARRLVYLTFATPNIWTCLSGQYFSVFTPPSSVIRFTLDYRHVQGDHQVMRPEVHSNRIPWWCFYSRLISEIFSPWRQCFMTHLKQQNKEQTEVKSIVYISKTSFSFKLSCYACMPLETNHKVSIG